ASLPLKKRLWQQTVKTKIQNQAELLRLRTNSNIDNMLFWADSVTSGDSQNHEARAAAYYWANLFPAGSFKRGREEDPPNNLFNYGYAILRAVVARSLVASGLLPTLGIHHHNRYNAYCLADDIMEPDRPFVDKLVIEITDELIKKNPQVAESCYNSQTCALAASPEPEYHSEEKKEYLLFDLTKEIKAKLLGIPVLDVNINNQRS